MADFYRSRRALSAGSIFFIVFFILVFIGAGYLFYIDQGIFWDYSLYIFIPAVVINLILMVFYFVKRSISGYVFLLFFLIFLTMIILSSFIGPFALINSARESYDNKQYSSAIVDFEEILGKYPNSRHAREASEKIAHAYYSSGDYENAIGYFQEAIEDGIIDGNSLEIKKILADSNLKIAEYYQDQKDFVKAMEYFLASARYFEEIAEDFPDTNDAFIASYRLPEYLHLAASSASTAKLWEQAEEILIRIIEEYPESEFSRNAEDLLFYNILRHSNDLKSEGEDRQSIETFMKVFDLEQYLMEEKQSEIAYYKKYLFENTPANVLVQLANEFHYSAEYEKAMFLYDYLLQNHPNYENTILKNLVENKIILVSKSIYETLEQGEPSGSFSSESTSRITIENRADHDLTQYMGGPEHLLLRIEKQSKTEIEIASGLYRIVVEFNVPGIYPLFGEIDYEEGRVYRQVYEPEEEENL